VNQIETLLVNLHGTEDLVHGLERDIYLFVVTALHSFCFCRLIECAIEEIRK
jgi:hypothetical protein